MSTEPPKKITVTLQENPPEDLQKRDDIQFRTEIEQLVQDAENMRLSYMRKNQKRKMLTLAIGLLFICAGTIAFGYLFFMNGALILASAAMVISFFPFALLQIWASRPPHQYKKAFKVKFLPMLAKTLGGLKYFQTRGIAEKIVRATGVLPTFDRYHAEDCFMGKYKGVKVILSEARLYRKKYRGSVFDGVFVLLEIPNEIFEGHTIITADIERAGKWQTTRWQKLSPVKLAIENAHMNRFRVYSDHAESASLMIGEKLLRELAETADAFGKSLLSTVLFRGKYIFMAIPYEGDMFEPSDISMPVTTRQHALSTKQEMDRIMEIIDIFELYNSGGSVGIPKTKP